MTSISIKGFHHYHYHINMAYINMPMPWEDDLLDFSELESRMAEFVDRSAVEDNIKIQLAEFEMLQSMFSNPKEVVVDDPSNLVDLEDYSKGKGTALPPQLDFHIYITIEDKKFEINVTLPLDYPTQEPDVFVRNDELGRNEQHSLNEDLSRFISSLPRDEMCIYSGITWLQDNATNYLERKTPTVPAKKVRALEVEDWARMWIYSHHIYSKNKRRELQDLANEFNITGFCLPGRPGVICFEGTETDCEDCWQKVRMMNWKKIICVKKETGLCELESSNSFRKFENFREVCFEAGKVKAREFHMDFGELYRFLCDHNCDYAFKMLFGVNGRTNT